MTVAVVVAVGALLGCATQQQMLASKQSMAMQTAANRGQFEMSCPQATPVLLSNEMTQPAIRGPWGGGIERAEYTIGVEGCGQRRTYVVVCPEGGDSCFAADSNTVGQQLEQR